MVEVAPIEDNLVEAALVEDDLVEAGSPYLLTGQAAILGAPGMSASSFGLGSTMAPPGRARLLGCWLVPRPRFPVLNPDQA